MMKKLLCAALVLAMSAVGCGDKDDHSHAAMVETVSSGYTASSDELPYGASMTELRPGSDENIQIMIDFDNRYFGGDDSGNAEIYRIDNFIHAVNANDHELFRSSFYPGALEQMVESAEFENVDNYIDEYYSTFTELLGENFCIDYINISDCITEPDSTATEYFNSADAILTKVGGVELLQKTTSKKVVEIGGYTTYTNSEGSKVLTNSADALLICVYCIDGDYYIF